MFNITIVSFPILYVLGNWKSVYLIYDLWIDVNRKVSSTSTFNIHSGQTVQHSFSKVSNISTRSEVSSTIGRHHYLSCWEGPEAY